MRNNPWKFVAALFAVLVLVTVLASCSSPTPAAPAVVKETVVVKQTAIVKETSIIKETVKETQVVERVVTATPAPATTPTPEKPIVGGTFVIAFSYEPDTLDPHKTTMSPGLQGDYLSPSLVTWDPTNHNAYVPYLAQSWKASADGLTWEFKLKSGLKFTDGTPLTAKEYAWTFNRALDPATGGTVIRNLLSNVKKVEAVDELTLHFTLGQPSYGLLDTMSQNVFVAPLSPTAVQKFGVEYGRNPVSAGPFKFKEWQQGQKIVLERNPDFNWGPAFMHQGPPNVQTIEIRSIFEAATIQAGLETGQIDMAYVNSDQADLFKSKGYRVVNSLNQGMSPYVVLNVTKPPFDDVRVRQALNYAVDRAALIRVVGRGYGQIQYGPLSASTPGYWPGVEKIAYGYDFAKAQYLLAQAGYKANKEGILEKDGVALKFDFPISGNQARNVEAAVLLKAMFKRLGVDLNIQQYEVGQLTSLMNQGNFLLGINVYGAGSADVLFNAYHSSRTTSNLGRVNDPELDKILASITMAMDGAQRQKLSEQAQQMIVEKAYTVPLWTPVGFAVFSPRVKGTVYSSPPGGILLNDAWLGTAAI